MERMRAPWPLDPCGDVLAQTRFLVWEFEGAKFGHVVIDDPDDHGGRTLSGLTRRCYSEDFLRLPAGALCPVKQFDALTLDDVVDVMLEVFAMRTNIWQIADPATRMIVLDFAVHAGAHDDAIPSLQRALGVSADGVLGPHTRAAAARVTNLAKLRTAILNDRYAKAARQCWNRKAKRATNQCKFIEGWIDRFNRLALAVAA